MRTLRKIKEAIGTLRCYLSAKVLNAFFAIRYGLYARMGFMPPVKDNADKANRTSVDSYWGDHTVNSRPFMTASQSKQYLEWRSSAYPLSGEFMRLYGDHDDQVILDYGCGPGDDLTGFAIYSSAKRIIGIDVSEKALRLAQYRLALHRVDPGRIELIHISDVLSKVPLDDNGVDYVHCGGVLHHVSQPELVLKEFYRVLKPGSTACIMVYNYDSLWLHLYTAYESMIIQGRFPGLTVHEAFSKNTDGEECPLSRCYSPQQLVSMCQAAGFDDVEYVGGYLSDTELNSLHKYGQMALEDERLDSEHKAFLRSLEFDARGFPKYKGKHAGIGGVCRLLKR